MNKEKISYLVNLLASGQATQNEKDELFRIYSNPQNRVDLLQLIDEVWDQASFEQLLSEGESDRLFQTIQQKKGGQTKGLSRSYKFMRWIAAASVIIAFASGWWWFQKSETSKEGSIASQKPLKISAPTSTHAVLTTAEGKTVSLSDKNNIDVQNLKEISSADKWLTISNPRSSRPVALFLSDGTRLWLSAESSIKYPRQFSAHERRVQISGEAYFEVAHDASRPFYVTDGKMEIKVLGTHFNVNTFSKNTQVTLLEGLVQVLAHNDSMLINPGQAAIIGEKMRMVKADTSSVMAWRNDIFSFEERSIKDIMQEICRWYNTDAEYIGEVPENLTLSGSINRSTDVEKVLEMLQLSSGLHFTIKDRTIIVNK